MEQSLDNIGKFIKNKRKMLGIKQFDLAELSGITTKALSEIENDKADPKLSTVKGLLSTLGYRLVALERVES